MNARLIRPAAKPETLPTLAGVADAIERRAWFQAGGQRGAKPSVVGRPLEFADVESLCVKRTPHDFVPGAHDLAILDGANGDYLAAFGVGALPDEYAARLAADIESCIGVYVVWSYGTVIAWSILNEVTVPNVRYSETTSHHQHMVMNARGAQWLQLPDAPASVSPRR